uniref:Uncharacterized protein n=1 Tax=Arundo donax TaxID=35708 RepID=A0A0A8Y610_ARUDO
MCSLTFFTVWCF